MAKNIEKFVKEIRDYINNFIVGTENTRIINCPEKDLVLNRGHAIVIEVFVPKEIAGEMKNQSATFYAEELIKEFPHSTPASIAEHINVRMNENYPHLLQILKEQQAAVNKTLDEYDSTDIIVAARTTPLNRVDDNNPYAVMELPEFGLTLEIKGAVCTNPANEDETYFIPVKLAEGKEITKEQWDDAKLNTLLQANIHCVMMVADPNLTTIKKPIAGEILDINRFADYFYLLNIEHVWKEIAEMTDAERIYIIPIDAYHARFVIYNEAIRNSKSVYDNCRELIASAKEEIDNIEISMPMFVLDCETMKVSKAEKEDEYAN